MDITNFISSQVQIGLDIATSFSILGAGYVIFLSRNKERKQLQNQHELLQRHYVIDNLKVFLNNFSLVSG